MSYLLFAQVLFDTVDSFGLSIKLLEISGLVVRYP